MPVAKHVGDLANPEEFHGMNPQDVLRHIKGFDDKGRKLLPQAYKKEFWVAMTPIQRKKSYYSNSMCVFM
jgi:hypothetical protein